jgi:hypothetical protein
LPVTIGRPDTGYISTLAYQTHLQESACKIG